jgi:hypothetical protein
LHQLDTGDIMTGQSQSTEKSDRKFVSIKIPRDLYVRIGRNRKSTGLMPDEFVFDAISEKLASIHKERRKRKRL